MRRSSRNSWIALFAITSFAVTGCGDNPLLKPIEGGVGDGSGEFCSIDNEIVGGGVGKDGIPALTNPTLANVDGRGTEYLRDDDRVIGIFLGGTPVAVPHNIGWWHEIVNLDNGANPIAVTYCPLTGSSMVFDRTAVDGAELGVSGLLYRNNLIMYDRNTEESLWPQMERGSRCGPRTGTDLEMVPSMEMTWGGWRSLHPDTWVVTDDPRRGRDYRQYPYPGYEDADNEDVFFPIPRLDRRRPLKERVLGIPGGENRGIAFPFGELDGLGSKAAIHVSVSNQDVVVFWDGEHVGAVAHRPTHEGQALMFEVQDDRVVDVQTGSTWLLDGSAVSGPLAGARLEQVAEAYVAFWFAWAVFESDTVLWEADD